MSKYIKQFLIFTVVMGISGLVGADAFAAVPQGTGGGGGGAGGYTAGASLLTDFVGNLEGTGGTTVGLLISLVGLYMWIWNQVSWGIFVAVGGALLTAFPGIFANLQEGSKSAFTATTNNSISTN